MATCPKCKNTTVTFPCSHCGYDGEGGIEHLAKKGDTGER